MEAEEFDVLQRQPDFRTNNSTFYFSVPIASIKEVRSGKTTDALKNKEIAGIYPDECAFSIVFGDNFESMDLIANTPDEANIWVTGLTCLINTQTTGSTTCMYLLYH